MSEITHKCTNKRRIRKFDSEVAQMWIFYCYHCVQEERRANSTNKSDANTKFKKFIGKKSHDSSPS